MTLREIVATIIAESFPQLAYGFPRSYVVTSVNADETLDLAPALGTAGLRTLRRVGQWTLGGGLVKPTPGASVVVAFADADPAKPVVVGFGPGTPDELHLCGKTLGVARETDAVQAGPFAGVITHGSAVVKTGAA